ncbi:recombination regulator RecX [Denitratisoma oestradiolicum]|uniref:Regulatory protein RecX n=1 Tax=Denitratisoma oestradiolicum TaxID=311182 RepID=A0A6S6Y321_9PROT|nr:recombination regulator RecX [Denitratisoma oestradiolicum]TWO80747.1 recombination regulator RecX [Denitratisoma oestradiolicum]CAB1370945.1 Regulatory protein RecX [Denitratisoma oestradiolicum]
MNDLKPRAIRLLARREHSRAELARKLSPYGSPEEVDIVLTELQDTNLLSDARFAQSYLRSHGERLGAARLRQTLRTKGVDEELIAASLREADLPDEMARARAIWARKFAAPPADAREWARQARFLQSRGFGTELIRKVLKESAE